MAATTPGRATTGLAPRSTSQRLATETKHSSKTSELYMAIAVVVGILVSAAVINGGDSGGTDEFIARQAWLYVAIVAAGYMISRGLAKAGSRDPYWADGSTENRDRDRDRPNR
jgi:hypothetical protein